MTSSPFYIKRLIIYLQFASSSYGSVCSFSLAYGVDTNKRLSVSPSHTDGCEQSRPGRLCHTWLPDCDRLVGALYTVGSHHITFMCSQTVTQSVEDSVAVAITSMSLSGLYSHGGYTSTEAINTSIQYLCN